MDLPHFSETFLATYEILRPLGEGGMATVWLARHRRLGREVAIKLLKALSRDEVARFVREGQVLAKLVHPSILSVQDAGDDGGIPYLVCELVDGETLAERHQREPLGLLEALEALRDVARALAFAHARDVVHRDVKPANVFLPRAGGGCGWPRK